MTDRNRLVELKREALWRKWSKDEAAFLRDCWYIQTPASGKVLFDCRQAQLDGLNHWKKNRYSLTLKARQIGWSTLVAAHVAWLAIFKADQNIIMISRTEREAVTLLRKTKFGFRSLPSWVADRAPSQVGDNQQRIQLSNGSQISSMPSASDPARGESATLIVVDEWAFLPNPEEAWASIEPVADVGGSIIGLSTPNGSGNFFHGLWVGSTTGNNQFKPMFQPWSANSDRDQEWYEAKKRALPSWQLAQEYSSNPEEAFIRSGRTVFDIDALNAMVVPVEPQRGFLQELTSNRDFQWRPNYDDINPNDPLRVWETPKMNTAYVIGADTAEGLEWGDYSSAHVISMETGSVVATWHGHIAADLFADELFKLGLWYNTALLGVESNNHGLTTITALRRLGYQKLFRRRRLNSTAGRTAMMEFGWQTSKTSKPLMIDELAADLRGGHLGLQCAETLAELRTYVRDEAGRMSGSPYDDRVISLAIANQMTRFAYNPEYHVEEDTYMTFDWWANLESPSQEQFDDDWTIGEHSVRGTTRTY
jgi:hypothetical protein